MPRLAGGACTRLPAAGIESDGVSVKSEMPMKKLLGLAAALEGTTGIALMIDPPAVARLLLGGDLTGAGAALGRVAGLGLLSLGLACWPGSGAPRGVPASLQALLIYNLLLTIYLLYLGIGGEWVGRLLWPAVVLHAVLTLLLASVWFKER